MSILKQELARFIGSQNYFDHLKIVKALEFPENVIVKVNPIIFSNTVSELDELKLIDSALAFVLYECAKAGAEPKYEKLAPHTYMFYTASC